MLDLRAESWIKDRGEPLLRGQGLRTYNRKLVSIVTLRESLTGRSPFTIRNVTLVGYLQNSI